MEIATKIEAVVDGFKSQEVAVESIKSEIADLKDAFAGLAAANEAQVEVKDEAAELKAKFYDVVQNGDGTSNTQIVKDGLVKSFNTQEANGGGAGIVTEVSRSILKRLRDDYVVAGLFGHETVSSVDHERRVQVSGSSTSWVGENVNCDGVPQTATPTFETIKITHGKIQASPVLTSESLTDTFFDAESFVLNDVAEELSRGIALGVLTGNGANKPRGFYTYFDAVEGIKPVQERKVDHFPVIIEADLTDEKLLEVVRRMPYKMPAKYIVGGKYIVTREMFERLAGLKDSIGRHYLHTSAVAGEAGRLFGYPVVIDPMNTQENMPIVFGHLDRAFKLVTIPTAMEFIRNPYVIPHCVRFDFQHRVGTMVGDNQAVIGLMVQSARKAK